MILFVLGVILGLLIRDIKCYTLTEVAEYKKALESKGETQFLEPISVAEKFKSAKTIEDILDNFNKK